MQSADGRVADLDAIAAAAAHHGARTFIDATQACGWLPLDAARFDYVACAATSGCSARAAGFMARAAGGRRAAPPHLAGWYAGETPLATVYGAPLRLAADARGASTSRRRG